MNQKNNIPRCQILCEFSRSICFILFTLCGHRPALNLCVCVFVCVIQPSHVQTHTVVLKSHRRETIGGLRWILSVLGTLLGSYRVVQKPKTPNIMLLLIQS